MVCSIWTLAPVCVVTKSAKHLASAEWRWSTPPSLLHTLQWSWCGSMGHVQTRLAALMLGHVGEMLVARAAAGYASVERGRALLVWTRHRVGASGTCVQESSVGWSSSRRLRVSS